MTVGLGGGALVPCSECLVGPALLVEGFVSHPFRKERGKSGAPGALRCAREILRGLASVQDDGWVGGWRAGTVQRVLCGAGFLVEGFVSHPFRKERGKSGAPGALRCAREILHGLASAQDDGWVGRLARRYRATRALWGPASWLRVSSPTLSAKNAERVGHPALYVVRARSFADLRPLRMTVGVGGWRAGTVLRVLCGDRRCWLRVSSPTLSAKNAERVGHPALYVVRARSFADLRPLRMTVGVGGWRAGTVLRVLCGDRLPG